MKKILSITVLINLLISTCQVSENRAIIYEVETDDYQLVISKIQTKIDTSGKAQCANYHIYSQTDSIYKSYGNTIRKELILLLKSKPKYVETSLNDSLSKIFLDINLKAKVKLKTEQNKLIIEALNDIFHLKIDSTSKEVDAYQLVISNPQILEQKIEPETKNSSTHYTKGTYLFQASKLNDICYMLNNDSRFNFFSQINDNKKYSFEFKLSKEIEDIKSSFNKVGLSLEKKSLPKTFYKISTFSN